MMDIATARDFATELYVVRLAWHRSAGTMDDREVAYVASIAIEDAADEAGVRVDITAIDEAARLASK